MKNKTQNPLQQTALGKQSAYESHYDANLLFILPRDEKRQELGISASPPFYGFDLWNHYEVSWLNNKGKPMVAIAEVIYDCMSPGLVESKSLKLYFNSLNNTQFKHAKHVEETIKQDLERALKTPVVVNIIPIEQINQATINPCFTGGCLDKLDVECSIYEVEPALLTSSAEITDETVYSNLLKSNCLVTGQPDWGSIQIHYRGPKINHEGLLKYIISYRNHNEFHEQCIERIFMDIMKCCQPETLTVYGRYTRRGGLDINPLRTTNPSINSHGRNKRLVRQ